MRDFWKAFTLSTVVGAGLLANALLAQSGTIGSGPATMGSSSLDSAFDSRPSSLDTRSSLEARSTLSGTTRLESRINDGLLNSNSSLSGSIYRDGSLDPFRDRDMANLNATRFYVNPLGSPYANGNANAYER